MSLLILTLTCCLTGCGSSDLQRFDVAGSVTFAGQPVAQGMVFFDPDVAAGQDGVQGYAEIENGRFDTEAAGKGLAGGKYVVRIRGFGPAAPGKMPPVLFDEFKTTTELLKPSEQLAFDVPKSAAKGAMPAADIP